MTDLIAEPKRGLSNIVRRLLLLGIVLALAGLALGLTGSGDCGSAWSPADGAALDPSCQQHADSYGPIAAVVVAFGGVVGLAALLAWHQERLAIVVLKAVERLTS